VRVSERSGVADSAEQPVATETTHPRVAGPAPDSPARTRLLLAALALFAVSALVSLLAHWWHGFIDLQVYRNGARVWLDGGELYGPMPPVYGIGLPFTYPPLAALFFAPLALMPLVLAEVVVLATSLGCLGLTLWLVLARLRPGLPHSVVVSAKTGEGVAEALRLIEAELPRPGVEFTALVPYERGDLINRLHQHGEIDSMEHTGDGTIVVGRANDEQIGRVIAANAIHVSELTPVAQSLEDVFFELTGTEGGPA